MWIVAFFLPTLKQKKRPKPQTKLSQHLRCDSLYFVAWCSTCLGKLCVLLNSTHYSADVEDNCSHCLKLKNKNKCCRRKTRKLSLLTPKIPETWEREGKEEIGFKVHVSLHHEWSYIDKMLSCTLWSCVVDTSRLKEIKGMKKRNCVYEVCEL